MDINLRIFNIIRIFALRKYQIVRNFYIKNKEKEYMNRIFKRKLYDRLLQWKATRDGKTAILVEGARRVGKSTLVEQFAQKEYESYILRLQ